MVDLNNRKQFFKIVFFDDLARITKQS